MVREGIMREQRELMRDTQRQYNNRLSENIAGDVREGGEFISDSVNEGCKED